MDRMASGAISVVAAALIVFAAHAYGKEPKTERKGGIRRTDIVRKKGDARLGEVEIVGNPEHPQILFFLPRTKFRLLPFQGDEGKKNTILLDDKIKGENPG